MTAEEMAQKALARSVYRSAGGPERAVYRLGFLGGYAHEREDTFDSSYLRSAYEAGYFDGQYEATRAARVVAHA